MSLYSQYNQNQCAFNLMEGGSCCPPNTAVGKLAGDAVASGNASVIANRLAAFSCPSDTGDPYLGARLVRSGGCEDQLRFFRQPQLDLHPMVA